MVVVHALRHTRLLEYDLRDKDMVRIVDVAPGERPCVRGEPLKEYPRETRCGGRHGQAGLYFVLQAELKQAVDLAVAVGGDYIARFGPDGDEGE